MAKADMFLLVETKKAGVVKGESKDSVYRGQIDISGWSWGMSSSSMMAGGGSSSAGLKTALSELRLSKSVDRSSVALMQVMRYSDEIKRAVLTVRKAGTVPIDYFKITIESGRITSYEIGSPSGPELHEQISIAFEKMLIEYAEQDDKGAKMGACSFTAEIEKKN